MYLDQQVKDNTWKEISGIVSISYNTMSRVCDSPTHDCDTVSVHQTGIRAQIPLSSAVYTKMSVMPYTVWPQKQQRAVSPTSSHREQELWTIVKSKEQCHLHRSNREQELWTIVKSKEQCHLHRLRTRAVDPSKEQRAVSPTSSRREQELWTVVKSKEQCHTTSSRREQELWTVVKSKERCHLHRPVENKNFCLQLSLMKSNYPTEIRTSISPFLAVELNTTSALANYATEACKILLISNDVTNLEISKLFCEECKKEVLPLGYIDLYPFCTMRITLTPPNKAAPTEGLSGEVGKPAFLPACRIGLDWIENRNTPSLATIQLGKCVVTSAEKVNIRLTQRLSQHGPAIFPKTRSARVERICELHEGVALVHRDT
uniref:Uncharacterized protein n=1 Tax=Timema monikensis TaxID=170555 RepID=A0A7R9E4P0_9NEOP|nr:unnamed protein product [Timema monikensis]